VKFAYGGLVGEGVKKNPEQYGHNCSGFFLTPSPSSSPTSIFFLGNLKIPQKREAYIVAERCTHFPQLLVWERKKKHKFGMKMGKELKRTPNKCAHTCSGFFLTPSPTSPPYANFTSAKNDLQYQKKFGQAK